MRQTKVILQILSISLIFSTAFSSDFSRFISQDEVIKTGVGELQLIMEGFDWASIIDSQEKWNYTETGHTFDSYLSIDSFNLTGYKIDTAQLRGDLDGQLLIKSDAKPTIDLVFEFKYLGRTTYTSKFVGTGKVRITDEGFNFRKSEKADGSIDTELQLVLNVNIDINGTSDDTLMTYFSKIKSDHSDLIKPRLIRLLNDFIQDFYKKVKDTTITFETTSPNFNYTYTLGFSQPPVYTQKVGVTYYYKGNLKRTKSPALKFLVGDDEYSFDPKDGKRQAFINYAALKSLFTDFSTTDKLQFDINEKTKIPEFKFLLNVDFLGQIIPAIYNTKARDERIHVKTALTDLSYDHTTSTLSTNAKFDIYDSKEANLFSWTNALKVRLFSRFDQKQVSINFSFRSVSIVDTTVTLNNYGPADEQTLSNWVRDSFENVFAKYITSLFKASVNLSSFLTVSSVVEKQTGLLVIG